MVEPLPGGNYILEIARTTMDLTRGYFTLNVWHPLPERVHADVKRLGNTGLDGAGATLEGFLDARGSLCYGAHPTCPTNNDNPFDPPSIEYPWLPFITDECSIPRGLVEATEKGINLLNTLIRAIANPASLFSRTELVDLAQYLRDHPKFGTQTVSLVFACMRHDFNWRNLYRVEHHLQHEGAWNNTAREQADERFHLDLRRLCDANRGRPPVTHRHYSWKVPGELIAKCHRVALAMSLGVQANPMLRIKYGSDEV